MATYIQTENGLKKLADKTTKKTIEEALGYIPSYTPNINDYDGDTFYITDSKGNVIFKVDKDGLHSVDFYVKNKSILEIIEEAGFSGDYNDLINKPNITEDGSDTLYFTDEMGNIITTIDSDGIHAFNVFVGTGDKEVALQEDLTDLSNTISENISTAIQDLNKDVEELVNTKADINHLHNDLVSDTNDLTITDNNGNIIMRVDQDGVHSTAFYISGKSIDEVGFSGDYNDLTNKPDFVGLSSTVNSLSQSVTSVVDEVDVLDSEVTSLKQTDTNLSNQISSLNTNKSNINHSHNDLVSDSFDFSIADNNGNIIATINQDGLNTVNLMLDGIDFSTKIDSKFEPIQSELSDTKADLSDTKTEVSGLKTTVNTINSNYFPKENITYSTTDLTAGSSALTTGKIYIVYE